MNHETSNPYSDSDSKQEMVILALFLKEFLVLTLIFVEVFIPFSLSAIFVWSCDLSTPTTPPQKVVYSEQLLHSWSLILDWNSTCPG